MRNFREDEFACKCGCGINRRSPKLDYLIDYAREQAGIPFVLNSACRCPDHNRAEGGKDTSSHLCTEDKRCTAVDIKAGTSRTRFKVLLALLMVGFHRIGIAETFIHADCDETKPPEVVWLY